MFKRNRIVRTLQGIKMNMYEIYVTAKSYQF